MNNQQITKDSQTKVSTANNGYTAKVLHIVCVTKDAYETVLRAVEKSDAFIDWEQSTGSWGADRVKIM